MQNVGKYREVEQKLVYLRQNPLEAQTCRNITQKLLFKKEAIGCSFEPQSLHLAFVSLSLLQMFYCEIFTMFCFRPEKEHKSEFILDSRSSTNHNYSYDKGQRQPPHNCHRTDRTSHSGQHQRRHISNAKHSTGAGVIIFGKPEDQPQEPSTTKSQLSELELR